MSSIVHGIDYEILDEAQLPYIHVRNLGHGHSGNVEEVKDRVTLEVYACKTIRITGSKKERAERTRVFRNEVEIIRGLEKHWHIISLHATYATKRFFSILLQPVASDGDLEEFLAEYRDIAREQEAEGSTSTRVTAMTGVLMQAFGCLAAGLAFMHEKRIRHKDIKPRNILVHKDMVIYTDFGYSFDSNGFTRSTTEGRPDFLTRRYSAPEVLSYEERNSKSDVYSLGCVYIDVASALTGLLSIDADKCFMEIMDQLHAQLSALTTPSLPDCLPILITSMTQLESASRISAGLLARGIIERPGLSCRQCMADEQGIFPLAYFVRNREFFNEGRVFSIILSEPAGSTRAVTGYNSCISEVRFRGNFVHTQSRRFVVVRRRPEFSYACPIFTYSNRGTTKKGVRPDEHGIAYSDGRQPECVKGETGIKKQSIAVVMALGEPSLHVASRIYYGIHHPIQYNVKVKDIGQVVKHHVPTLIGNWKAEDGGETQQAPEITAAAEDSDVNDGTHASAGKDSKGDRKRKRPSKASIHTIPDAPKSPTSHIDHHLYHPRDNVYGYHSKTNPHMYHPTHNPYGYHPTNNQHGYHPESNQYSYHPTHNKVGYHPTMAPFCYHPSFSPHGYHAQQNIDGYHPDVTPYNWHPQSNPHGYHPDSNPTAYHPQRNPLGTKYTPTTQGHQSQSETQEYYATNFAVEYSNDTSSDEEGGYEYERNEEYEPNEAYGQGQELGEDEAIIR
tara:strand:+ start:1632 stop:3824 length:2193 start_codon:yes stop_codon:yes gene_type:complete